MALPVAQEQARTEQRFRAPLWLWSEPVHIHAQSMAEQSAVQHSQVSQSPASLNSTLECDFERHFERHC